MNLLTYLGAKKDKCTLLYKNDLVSFLMGKKASSLPEQTASGTTLEITAKKKNIIELTLDHMCEQTGTPTPSNPIAIVVAEGELTITITNGVETKTVVIDLGNNFIGGIGNYKDKLTIDESGNVSLVKNVSKIILDENSTVGKNKQTENYYQFYASIEGKQSGNNFKTNKFLFNRDLDNVYQCAGRSNSNRIIFNVATTDCVYSVDGIKGWLQNNNVEVYYVTAEPTTIDLGTIDIELFKGTNTITNSDNCNMTLKYY